MIGARLQRQQIRRDFKPDFPVRIRMDHSLAGYLSSLTLPNDTNPVDLVSGQMGWAKVGAIDPSISKAGTAVKGDGSTGYLSRSINVSSYRPHLMLAVFEATVVSATPKTIYSLGSAMFGSSAYIRISNGSDTTTPIMAQIRSVDNSTLHTATGPAPTVGELYACAWYVSSTSSADNKLWVNGTSYTATGGTLQASGSGTFVHEAIGTLKRGTLAHYSPDHILLVARGIPPLGTNLDAVLREWTQNPWDLLEPERSRTIFIFGSGLSRRALILDSGRIRQITDAQVGTGQKPLVLDAGRIKQRVASEGNPLVLVNGRIREIMPNETLII